MNNQQIYEMIEKEIVSQLENGIVPWRKCYHLRGVGCAISHQTKEPYSLLNQFLLSEPGEYWTFNQAAKSGFHVRKGAKARKIFFWRTLEVEKDVKREWHGGLLVESASYKQIPMLKWYNVFHEKDIEGLPDKPLDAVDVEKNKVSIIEADSIINNYLEANKDITLVESDTTPCFSPSTKTIHIPKKCQFDSIEDYYATTFHEMTHSTADKLGRDTKALSMNDPNYAREELVAEIGAAYLCGASGIKEESVIKNNASYCRHWLFILRNNIKDLVWASSRAEAASKFILGEKEISENEDG